MKGSKALRIPEEIIESPFVPFNHCILYGYRGSIAHNLYIDPEEEMGTDDEDFMGVSISPINYYLGLKSFSQEQKIVGSKDFVIYDIKKFFTLLIKSNPNVLSFLWNNEEMFHVDADTQEINPLGRMILDNRDIFSSKQAYIAFQGYSQSQLRKLESGAYKGYMGSKRKDLVDKFGYDVKFASHLIRLLRMGGEFLRTGRMKVYRAEDREELISIKQGKWKKEKVITEANDLFLALEDAYDNCKLPNKVSIDKVEGLLYSIMRERFNIGEAK